MRPDGTLAQTYGGEGVDASALMLVVFDLLPPRDPRAERLVNATIRALGAGPLLHRYPPDGRDGYDPGEAPFVPASWWAVTALAKLGHPDAQARADELCRMLPALQPEAFDPARREALGNTPLLWSHAECTRALFELDRQRGWKPRARRRFARGLRRD
jgi:GH15 family glucan-1,4-alpha-glucosidase